MKSYSITDVGQKRKENQDYVYASETPVGNLPNLFVVADGMGGHNAGDFASSFSVQVLLDSIRQDINFNPIKIIRTAMEKANGQLILEASKSSDKAGMGTTMVVTTIIDHYAYVANVGDSRLYLIDEEGITQVTKDHSLVQEMVRLGEISKEDAKKHPDKNIITRAIGAASRLEPDFFDVRLEEESILLLCSDGLSNMIDETDMVNIVVNSDSLKEAGEKLVSAANANGGRDNIAVVLVKPETKEVEVC